jgi:hypothetical protein
MRHLKDYLGDGGIDRLLQELGLTKGAAEDHQQAEALYETLPAQATREMMQKIGIAAEQEEADTPTAGYREAWLAIQAATFCPSAHSAHR